VNQCKKGKAGEREAAHYLAAMFGIPVSRGAQHAGGAESPDIKGVPGLHFEVKRVERLNLADAMAQAVRDAAGKAVPVVLHRRNRGEWCMTIRGDDAPSFARAVILAIQAGEDANAGKEAVHDTNASESKNKGVAG
jgi:hypothetical protein